MHHLCPAVTCPLSVHSSFLNDFLRPLCGEAVLLLALPARLCNTLPKHQSTTVHSIDMGQSCLQAYASATEDFVSPWEGYHEPLYDDHEVLKRWTPGPDITMSVDCLEALGPVMEFAHVAAQKLADRALQSAIDGAVADVIQVRSLVLSNAAFCSKISLAHKTFHMSLGLAL